MVVGRAFGAPGPGEEAQAGRPRLQRKGFEREGTHGLPLRGPAEAAGRRQAGGQWRPVEASGGLSKNSPCRSAASSSTSQLRPAGGWPAAAGGPAGGPAGAGPQAPPPPPKAARRRRKAEGAAGADEAPPQAAAGGAYYSNALTP